MQFNERLSRMRKRYKITQKSLAEHLGITVRTYQRYEAGTIEPPLSTVAAISEYLDIPTDYLLGNGFFANWEEVFLHKDAILCGLAQLFPSILGKLDLSLLSEKQLMRLLPAVLAKATFNEGKNIITLYPLVLPLSNQPVEVSFDGQAEPLTHPNA